MPKHRNAPKLAGHIDTTLHYRAVPLKKTESGAPATLDEANRSVEIVASTEAPVMVFDWERWEMVPEVLLMSGCQIPSNRQVPLLDTHIRYDTSTVIGSARDLEVQETELIARAHYSKAPEAEGPYLKMTEGHLTDYSVGYRYDGKDAVFIPEGETGLIDGRTFTGPVKVVRKWQVKEVSACPIGADEFAKARAATAPHTPQHKENDMDEKLRKFLESRGLAKNATEEEAWRFLETLNVRSEPAAPQQPGQSAPARTEEEIRAEAVRAEQERIRDIRAICARAGMEDAKIDAFITEGKSVEEVRTAAFDHVTNSAPEPPGFRAQVVVDARDKFRAAAEHGLLLRAGRTIETPAAGADELRGFSLREMAREALRVAGQPTGGDPMQMVGRALTSSDLPTLLGNVANLSLMEGYQAAEETWNQWCGTGSVSDFKVNTMARAGEMDDLDEIGEDDEYKYGSRSEGKEQFQIATYGKLFKISRQAIINDELGALTDIPAAHGEAWSRKVGDLAYAVLTANAAMGDGTALFHGNHGNLGTGGALSETTVAEAIKLMKLQKDISGKRRLNIRPQFLIAPVALEGAAEIFFASNQFTGDAKDSTRANPYAGSRFTRVYDARLDDDSAVAYYFAGPKGKTVIVFFLNGQQAPYLETRQGWTVDGVEYKVRGDAGAKAKDWRTLLKNAGQ